MQKRIIVPIVMVAGLGVAGVIALRQVEGRDPNRLLVSGNIELTEVNIGFKIAGRLVERTVDEGDAVKRGMVIARLDREQLERQRERELAGRASAEALYKQSETAVAWQRATLAADLEQRRADLEAMGARLRELKNGSRPQEIQEAKAMVEAAQAERDRAAGDWDRARILYKNDDISTSQFDQYRMRHESSEAALKQAKERAALVAAGPRSEVIDAAAAQYQRASAGLKVGEANRLELARKEEEVRARRAEIERARAQIALIDSQLADTIAYSPVDGVVLLKAADAGEILAPGTTVVTVGDIDHPWLRAYVGERDLGRVKLGSKVKVTTDSFPGKVYWGRVTFIASQAEFTPKQIQTSEERVKLVYRVKIEVANPRRELKSNMPADAEIVLED